MTEIGSVSKGVLCIAVALLLAGAAANDAIGQISGASTRSSDQNPIDLLRQRMAQSASSASSVPQEGAVDPATYSVGPGDVFQISIGGVPSISIPVTVSADGHLALPDAGAVQVAGLTLANARDDIHARLKLAYRNVPASATLLQPRQFYVHVVGAVSSPGRYLVMPVGRVLDAMSLAFADTTRPATTNLRFQPSFRNVSITGIDGSTRTADLMRYLITGETLYNPYLRDGDVIRVGGYDPSDRSVFVNGDVPFAGTYEYRNGDTVADLLALATGSVDVDDRYQLVRITRRSPDGTTSAVPSVANASGDDLGMIDIRPLDQLYFALGRERNGGVALAEGAVRYPGAYPITTGETSLSDLIDAVGGFRQNALLRGAYVERRAAFSMSEFPVRFVGLPLGPNMPPLFLPDTSAVLQRIRLAPLDWRGANYVTRELQSQRRVAINLAEASQEDMARVRLFEGDRLVVPKDDGTVFVFGQVNRAGFIAFEPGRPVSHYLAAAGGRADLAADAFLIEAGTGAYRRGEDSLVEPGDMIFVDSREYLADSAELSRLAVEDKRIEMENKRIEADQKFRTTQIILQTIGSVASIIALIIAARK
ncbi:MAG: SLBB domain-containing protein [Rhodothermia bacterium]|nr:SLBB domain-containing protein [Rhodothermia bacterium]